MKHLICLLFTLFCSSAVSADSQYSGNPNQPYPPSCVTLPGPFSPLTDYGELSMILDAKVDLFKSKSATKVPVLLTAYRLNCSESDRSLIWLQFIVPHELADDADPAVELPQVVMELPTGDRINMNLAEQPHLWGANTEFEGNRRYLAPGKNISQPYDQLSDGAFFILDSYSPLSELSSGLTASQYNDGFRLVLRYPPNDLASYYVPSLAESYPYGIIDSDLPLSGRLSGLWVVDGAEDQGFTIAVSSLPQASTGDPDKHHESLVLFLAHYTFDGEGNPMWLSGSVNFEPRTGEATIPMLKVNQGKFLGNKPTARQDAGSIRIKRVDDCNSIWIEYDYSKLGLGKANVRLQRKFSLETAGYECRDLEARITAVND